MAVKSYFIYLMLALVSCMATAAPHQGIDVTLSLDNGTIKNSENVYVKLTLHNQSSQSQRVLKWYLPDTNGELEEGVFNVARDGQRVAFEGPHYKRPAPTGTDYIVLKAHERRTFSAELSSYYDFSRAGNYQIEFSAENYALFDVNLPRLRGVTQRQSPTQLKSNDRIFVSVQADRSSQKCNPNRESCDGSPDGGTDPTGNGVSFSGRCSNSEQTTIMTALQAAQTITDDSVSYLSGSIGARFTTWFGEYNGGRWETVVSHFDAIKDALDNKPKTFDCSCNKTYFAYVYPAEPYKVYLCRAFWSASMTGTDSKAGTIVHEFSHFDVVAGTDDVVYGQAGAKNLAITDPFRAVQNADSHEYFAENTPYQD